MTDPTRNWSSYKYSPEKTLEVFEEARRRCPVAHSEESGGFYMLLNHGDVRKAMGDHKTFSSEPQVLRPVLPRDSVVALEMDQPQHSAWRKIFSEAITPRTPQAMEPFVRAEVNHHIDNFIERGSCDLVTELCEPVPAETICRLVGIEDVELIGKIRKAAIEMFEALGDPEEFARRQQIFGELTIAQVNARKKEPKQDFLTRLATMEVGGRPLGDKDYMLLMMAFLGAGHHSTTSAIASLIFSVLPNLAVRDEITKDPSRIPFAIEEALRLHPSFFGFFRRTTQACAVAGVELPAGADVYMAWAAANRDPQVFPEPASFRMDRWPNKHLTFGFGIHTCPGAGLARMEMRVVLEELLRRMPDLKLAIQDVTYAFGGGEYNCITSLPVTFDAGKANS